MRAAHLRITGRVQAVGYRAWVIEEAQRRGLRGWVRNRRDGSVEALLIGDDDSVAAMIEACREGPYAARVSDVVATDADDDGSPGFAPRATVYVQTTKSHSRRKPGPITPRRVRETMDPGLRRGCEELCAPRIRGIASPTLPRIRGRGECEALRVGLFHQQFDDRVEMLVGERPQLRIAAVLHRVRDKDQRRVGAE